MTDTVRLSDNQIIYQIRQDRYLSKIFSLLTTNQRREVLAIADGDTWHIDEIIEEVREDHRRDYEQQI